MTRQGDPNTPADDTTRRRSSTPNEERAGEGGGRGSRSEWQERNAPAADDPVSEAELKGLSIVGGSSIRDGAIPGVSDPVRDGRAGPHEQADDQPMEGGPRRNPPEIADAASEGGLSVSGGIAGGARGNAGRSDAGAGDPNSEGRAGPGEHKGTSRFDLDHPGTDVGDDR